MAAGCAGQQAATPPPPTTYVNAAMQPLAQIPASSKGDMTAQRLANAKKEGFTVVNRDGQILYCSADQKLGSHIARPSDAVCLTAEQLDARVAQTQAGLKNYLRPDPPPQGK